MSNFTTYKISSCNNKDYMAIYRLTEDSQYKMGTFLKSELQETIDMVESFGKSYLEIWHNAIECETYCF